MLSCLMLFCGCLAFSYFVFSYLALSCVGIMPDASLDSPVKGIELKRFAAHNIGALCLRTPPLFCGLVLACRAFVLVLSVLSSFALSFVFFAMVLSLSFPLSCFFWSWSYLFPRLCAYLVLFLPSSCPRPPSPSYSRLGREVFRKWNQHSICSGPPERPPQGLGMPSFYFKFRFFSSLVLSCLVSSCLVLRCHVLSYVVLCCVALRCVCVVLRCVVLCCVALHSVVLFCPV
jgi:hypothetical protein